MKRLVRYRQISLPALCTLVSLSLSTNSYAQPHLSTCNGFPAELRYVVEPWDQESRTYANGKIRVIHVNTDGEPACCASRLAILAPSPPGDHAVRQCTLLSDLPNGLGFEWINVGAIRSRYDPEKGLLLSIPIKRFVDGIDFKNEVIHVRINQSTGLISLE